jgi:hypothetical protein
VLFQYPLEPVIIDMPKYKKVSRQQDFCPETPKQYWIDWRKDGSKNWRRSEPFDKVKNMNKDMKVLYDYTKQQIQVHVRTPKGTPGRYQIVFSPNEWKDWLRFPFIVCHVEQPRYLFSPDDYNLKFRPENKDRRFDFTEWPVVGGDENNQCGTTKVVIKTDDERLYGGWF